MLKTLALTAGALATFAFLATAQTPPTIQYVAPTPPCQTVFNMFEGQTLEFDIKVVDSNPNSVAAFVLIEKPAGTIETPPSPQVVYGDGVNPLVIETHVSWTAPIGSAGQYLFFFDAANFPDDTRLTCGYYVNVFKEPVSNGSFCTYTQGGWGAKPSGNNPGSKLANNFASAFPTGIEIGLPGAAGKSLKFTSASAVEKFLPTGGKPGVLTADATNPTGKTSGGSFAGQVLALQISVGMSNAGVLPGGLANLKLMNMGNSDLEGRTIGEILAVANIALGGGGIGLGFGSISDLNSLVTQLNEALDNCSASAWAKLHLVK